MKGRIYTWLMFFLAGLGVLAAGKGKYVVVLVWDGMRPDFVQEAWTPNLVRLAEQGVTFQNHHSVYLSSTEVNGTAIATGMYPRNSGVIANKEFRPGLDPLKPFETQTMSIIRKSDAKGRYLPVATTAEILQAAGKKTVIAGTKPVALLHDRLERKKGMRGINIVEGKTLPGSLEESITNRLGNFPKVTETKIDRDRWTTDAMLGTWEEEMPVYSVLWFGEPDHSQHQTQPGSSRALSAIRAADENLGRVLAELERHGLRAVTDVFVVSDHGFSTIQEELDIAVLLRAAGFQAERQYKERPKNGEVVISANGGAVLLYVTGHEKQVVTRLVDYLQGSVFAGAIFTRDGGRGTFPLSAVNMDSPAAPDVMFSMRWNLEKNSNGVPGMIYADNPDKYHGMHVTLSRFDLHNTLIAAGPDFRRGISDVLPTGNTDLAPTILAILGMKAPKRMDGRVLYEAMTMGKMKVLKYDAYRLSAERNDAGVQWSQYLNVTELNGVRYFDEGNGGRMGRLP